MHILRNDGIIAKLDEYQRRCYFATEALALERRGLSCTRS